MSDTAVKDDADSTITITEAKEKIYAYCKKRGALVVGVVDIELCERVAPPGHGPRALMPNARSV